MSCLFAFYERKYLCQKYSDKSYDQKEEYFSFCIEKYGCNTKKCSEEIDGVSNFFLRKTDLHQTKVQMCGLVSLEGIFSMKDTHSHNIDKIDEVYSENCYCCCDLTTGDDGQGRDEKCEHNSTRIPHDHLPCDIRTCKPKSCRDNHCKYHKEKSAILDRSNTCVCQ